MSKMSVMLGMPIIHNVVHRGHSIESLFKLVPIRSDLMTDPDNRIEAAQYDQLMEKAADLCKDAYFGLQLGASYTLDSMGMIGYILLNSSTLRQAFENYQRYNILLCSGVVYELHVAGGEAVFTFNVLDAMRRPSYHLMDSIVASIYRILQKLAGQSLSPKRVSLVQEEPVDTEPYARLFGPNLIYGAKETTLVFYAEVLDLPIVYRNPQLLQVVEAHAAQMIRTLKFEETFSETVSHAIIRQFNGTVPRIHDISRSLGMSIRAIQLQLKREDTRFKDLLAVIRKNMAEGYLKNPAFTISDISYALGFSEPVAFHTAFKKWTGQTPGQYRKRFNEQLGFSE